MKRQIICMILMTSVIISSCGNANKKSESEPVKDLKETTPTKTQISPNSLDIEEKASSPEKALSDNEVEEETTIDYFAKADPVEIDKVLPCFDESDYLDWQKERMFCGIPWGISEAELKKTIGYIEDHAPIKADSINETLGYYYLTTYGYDAFPKTPKIQDVRASFSWTEFSYKRPDFYVGASFSGTVDLENTGLSREGYTELIIDYFSSKYGTPSSDNTERIKQEGYAQALDKNDNPVGDPKPLVSYNNKREVVWEPLPTGLPEMSLTVSYRDKSPELLNIDLDIDLVYWQVERIDRGEIKTGVSHDIEGIVADGIYATDEFDYDIFISEDGATVSMTTALYDGNQITATRDLIHKKGTLALPVAPDCICVYVESEDEVKEPLAGQIEYINELIASIKEQGVPMYFKVKDGMLSELIFSP